MSPARRTGGTLRLRFCIAITHSNRRPFKVPVALLSLLLLLLVSGCRAGSGGPSTGDNQMPKRDINAVLRDHDQELMATPGVVGVYVGLLGDQKTPCLRVMIVKNSKDLERALPKSLEGYKVEVEETGNIRPMK